MNRTILHSDLNNFYASVECMLDPKLQGHPVAVAGDPKSRHGIILAKNELAKQYGVATGEPLWSARQKCPHVRFVPPHYDLYLQYSAAARAIYAEYTDRVEPFGMDECWLDVSTASNSFGGGKSLADEIRDRIHRELGITVSVGVSYNKIFAKLGSDMKKPDATTVIERANFKAKIWGLPVGELLYAGPATCRRLAKYGIFTIGKLAQTQPQQLLKILGKSGGMLWRYANGLDNAPVAEATDTPPIKSIGNGTTTPRDLTDEQEVKITLYALSESVSARLRAQGLVCRTVQLGVRDKALHTFERQGKLPLPARTARAIFEKAFALYKENDDGTPIRSLCVRACDLLSDEAEQLSFMPDALALQKQEQLETAIAALRGKYGADCISPGLLLRDPSLSGLHSRPDHVVKYEVFNHHNRQKSG